MFCCSRTCVTDTAWRRARVQSASYVSRTPKKCASSSSLHIFSNPPPLPSLLLSLARARSPCCHAATSAYAAAASAKSSAAPCVAPPSAATCASSSLRPQVTPRAAPHDVRSLVHRAELAPRAEARDGSAAGVGPAIIAFHANCKEAADSCATACRTFARLGGAHHMSGHVAYRPVSGSSTRVRGKLLRSLWG